MLKINKNLRCLHLALRADLGAALKPDLLDSAYVKLLFFILIISFGTLFVTEGNVAHLMFIYLVTPVLFAPFKFKTVNIRGIQLIIPEKLSLYNLFRNVILCRTPLFLAVLIYGINKAFLSYLYPEANIGYLHIFFYYLLAPLLVLIIAIVRLCIDTPKFYYIFFSLMGPVAAINAAVNIYLYIKFLPNLAALSETHMSATFGAAIGHNPNLDCLIYATYLIGLLVTLIHNFTHKDYYFSIPAALILFLTILLEQSRSTLLGVLISLILLIYLAPGAKRKTIVSTLCVALMLILTYSFFFLPNGPATYFLRGQSSRSEVWLRYFDILMQNPILGFGDRTIREILLSDGERLFHAHSILLSSWLRGGLLGLGSMLYIAVFGIRRSFHFAKIYNNFVPFCVFIVVAVDGIFNSELKVWQAGWEWAGYWLAIALAVGADAKLRNDSRISV